MGLSHKKTLNRRNTKPNIFKQASESYYSQSVPKNRELKFKVGVNISQEGKVENSFGLRHMQRLR